MIETFRRFLAAIRPQGSFWSGAGASATMEALAQIFAGERPDGQTLTQSFVDRAMRLPLDMTPFATQYRQVLEQYYDYLAGLDCVPLPTDTEELRARVVELYSARSAAFADGFRALVNSYLPLVSVDDRPPPSVLPFELPAPLDAGHAVELWYTPVQGDTDEIVRCVGEAFAPSKSPVRVIEPVLVFNNPTSGVLAGDMALQWAGMLASDSPTDTEMTVTLDNGGPVLDSSTTAIDRSGIALLSDLLPGTAAGDNVSGHNVNINVVRTWAGGTRSITLDLYVFP